jgi:hypothetical protein
MKIIYKAFTLPHVGDPYRLCADRYSISTENNSFAISDGVGNSLFPGEWAKLICDDYVHFGDEFIVDDKLVREDELISTWSQIRDKIVEGFTEDEKFIYEMGLDKADFAAATFVGLRLNPTGWSCQALGDSYLVLLDEEYNILQKVASMDGQPFGMYPEYFASKLGENNGIPIIRKGDYHQVKYLILMTDAVSDWFIAEARSSEERRMMIEVSSHEEFIAVVNNLRQSGSMNDDDSTIVILTLENNEYSTISYEHHALDDINQLIEEEKPEEEALETNEEKKIDESLELNKDATDTPLISLDKDTKEQLTINDSTEPTPEKMVEIQAKEIVRLNDALERYSAEVIRLNTEIERLKEAKLCLSRENMVLYEQLNKIEDALNNNNESGEDKNFIQKLFCKKSNK